MEGSAREFRRHLHTIPEIGFDVYETRAYILSVLKGTRAKLADAAGTGVLAYFDFGKDGTAAFRADMDALGIEEVPDRELRSSFPGRMHACGHDAHMAMLLAFALRVDAMESARCNVLLVFQPSEETNGGGGVLVGEGVLERYRVREAYAFHVDPTLPLGQVAAREGPMMAMAEEMVVTVRGRSVHVAKYRSGADPIEAASAILSAAYGVGRVLPPDTRYLLRFGLMRAGSVRNILAQEAVLEGSVRGYSEETLAAIKDELHRAAREADRSCGTSTSFSYGTGYPPVINDAALYRKAKACVPLFAELKEPSMLAEDFGFYTKKVPGLMMFLGLGTGAALHSPQFLVDDRALESGVNAFSALLKNE